MKKNILVMMAMTLLALSSFAHADDTWLGNVRVRLVHRGADNTTAFDGQPIVYNLCDYNTYYIYFDYYQQGVTDSPGVAVWQQVDAQAQLTKDSNGATVNSGPIQVVGNSGNNAVYQVYLPAFNPQTVYNADPELQNGQTMHTHLDVQLNGNDVLSVPIDYSCTH